MSPRVSFGNRFDVIDESTLLWNVSTVEKGETTIEAMLPGLDKLIQRVHIVPAVKIDTTTLINGQHLILPQGHEFLLKATGGSGYPYAFSTREPVIVSIEDLQGGYLVKSGNLIGTSSIKCKDNKCPINQDDVQVGTL